MGLFDDLDSSTSRPRGRQHEADIVFKGLK